MSVHKYVAYHEAAHAVVGLTDGARLGIVSVQVRDMRRDPPIQTHDGAERVSSLGTVELRAPYWHDLVFQRDTECMRFPDAKTRRLFRRRHQETIERLAVTLLAGGLAEDRILKRWYGTAWLAGANSDFITAKNGITSLGYSRAKTGQLMESVIERATKSVRQNWSRISSVAEALKLKKRLSETQVRRIGKIFKYEFPPFNSL